MDKKLIIEKLLYTNNPDIDNIFSKYSKNSRKQISTSNFIDIISKPSYNIKELGLCATTTAKLLKELFPDRGTNSTGSKPCTFLLIKYKYKWCSHCNQVHQLNLFRVNSSQTNGYNAFCKSCQDSSTAKTQPFRQKKYQAAKLHRTPLWANLDIIKLVYDCAEGDHVDPIIPLQGIYVSGLHVETNLQYLSPHDNVTKSNNFKTDWEY